MSRTGLRFYKLIGKLAVPVETVEEWARSHDKWPARVAETKIGGVWVSTVFLGLDHNHSLHGGPLIFETMVFRGGDGEECERYESWDEAEAGHQKWVETVRAEIKDKVNE